MVLVILFMPDGVLGFVKAVAARRRSTGIATAQRPAEAGR